MLRLCGRVQKNVGGRGSVWEGTSLAESLHLQVSYPNYHAHDAGVGGGDGKRRVQALSQRGAPSGEREFFIDNLLVRVQLLIEMS